MSRTHATTYSFYRHRLPVRITHWVNALCLLILLMSGLQIFNAHPALYWGSASDFDSPWLALGRFPGWLTIPSWQSLATGRQWHFFFAWALVFNAALYLIWSACTGHLRDLTPTRADWRGFGRSVIDHIKLRHPKGEAAKRYNILQKLAYLIVIFGLGGLMVVTGLYMSPRMNTVMHGVLELLGGRQSARSLHFLAAGGLVLFVMVHLFEVAITGLWNNLRSMITGRYRYHANGTEQTKPEARHE